MHQVTVERALAELDRMLQEQAAGMASPWRVTEPDPNSDGGPLVAIR
jgi:hypothetical protein